MNLALVLFLALAQGPAKSEPVAPPLPSSQALTGVYDFYSREYFDGKLPDAVVVRWDKGGELDGDSIYNLSRNDETGFYLLVLSRDIWVSERYVRSAIIHASIHIKFQAAGYSDFKEHGKRYHEEILRLAEAGALDDVL